MPHFLQDYFASASATATATATVAPTMGLLPLGFGDIFVSFAYFTSTNRYYVVHIVRHIPMVLGSIRQMTSAVLKGSFCPFVKAGKMIKGFHYLPLT